MVDVCNTNYVQNRAKKTWNTSNNADEEGNARFQVRLLEKKQRASSGTSYIAVASKLAH